MNEDRICPNCSEPTESGAIFCGNCGFRLIEQVRAETLGNPSLNAQDIPVYAKPKSHHKKHWAAIGLVFGILGLGTSILVPFIGLSLGVVGLILISTSYKQTRGWIKPVSTIMAVLAIITGLGFWVSATIHDVSVQAEQQTSKSSAVATISVTTPCYSVTFGSIINVDNAKGSCSMNVYNGPSFSDSSNIYKIVASSVSSINNSNFASVSKTAISNDIAEHLPDFNITTQNSNLFDGNPAYSVYAYNQSSNVAMVEESVLVNNTNNKDNFFVIIHAINGQSANLDSLESKWQWSE